MATATIGRNDQALSHEQRVEAHALRIQGEVRSRADAKPMKGGDICNVAHIPLTEYEAFLKQLEVSNPRMYRELMQADEKIWGDSWDDWDDSDSRWTMTPHALRRERELYRKGR
jgi:hypothetical protein